VIARFDAHTPEHRWNPAAHWKLQSVPSHVAVAFAGTMHGEHDAPHVATSVLTAQLDPHAWKPVPHEKPHCVPSHDALP
jgi:hypothetical protein